MTEETPTFEDVLQETTSDCACKTAAQAVRFTSSIFTYDRDVVSIRQAAKGGELPKYISIALRCLITYLSHYLTLTGHPKARRMYDKMRHHLSWIHLANEVRRTLKDCCSCAQDGSQLNHRRKLPLSPAAGLLELVALDALGPLQKQSSGNQNLVTINDCY